MFRNFLTTAAAVFLLLSSQGQVQYYEVDGEEVIVSTYDNITQDIIEYFIWDFDDDGTDDFFMEAISFFDDPIAECAVSETYRFVPLSGDFLVGEYGTWNCNAIYPFVHVSDYGDIVNSREFGDIDVQYVFAQDDIYEGPSPASISGDGYMGFRFSEGHDYYYGWLRYEFSGSGFAHQFSLHEIAIQRTPNIPIEIGEKGASCPVFYSPPVDLLKSFTPVNGIIDRVQLKWYKDSPQVKYTDADAAMCDIKAWAVRNLDPETGIPVGPVIQNPDTILLVDKKKTYGDDSPRSIFKWPLFFRADGANNSKCVEPNTRYKFQVRCECGHDGHGWESPWSEVKTLNTPDFDPAAGIYSGLEGDYETKSIEEKMKLSVYPNPSDGISLNLDIGEIEISDMRLLNAQGQSIECNLIQAKDATELRPFYQLPAGVYFLRIQNGGKSYTEKVFVR